jgi:acyl dehydratase
LTDRIDVAGLLARVGEEAPAGDWVLVTQAMINEFADLTGDRQWIHVDEARACRESPFGGTIAHGLLVLSLVPRLMVSAGAPWLVSRLGVNYGADRLRFIAPVRANSRIRVRQALVAVEPYGESGAKVTTRVTVEIDGQSKPACVVDMIGLLFA